jgi:tRNA(fMet)-specific endonuclease VapC
MPKYLLDTNHITYLHRGGIQGANLRARLALVNEEDVVVSIVNYEEQMRGWLAYLGSLKSVAKEKNAYASLENMIRLYCNLPLLSFCDQSLEVFQELWISRIRVQTSDLKIASIALANNLILLTENARDFDKVPNLCWEDWTLNLPEETD